jgi:hypothetical protein
MDFTWKITELTKSENGLISAHYYVIAKDGENFVDTQGEWVFSKPQNQIPFEQLEERFVAQMIEEDASKDGINIIKSNLEQQLKALNNEKSSLPWVKPTFKPNIGL